MKPKSEHTIIIDEIIAQTRFHQKRTRVGPKELLWEKETIPDGLSPRVIYKQLSKNSKIARKEYRAYAKTLEPAYYSRNES